MDKVKLVNVGKNEMTNPKHSAFSLNAPITAILSLSSFCSNAAATCDQQHTLYVRSILQTTTQLLGGVFI